MSENPLWYKDAVFYELFIRAFKDSNHDGIGDIQGALEKIDYLQNLGVDCIWILPTYPSPKLWFVITSRLVKISGRRWFMKGA